MKQETILPSHGTFCWNHFQHGFSIHAVSCFEYPVLSGPKLNPAAACCINEAPMVMALRQTSDLTRLYPVFVRFQQPTGSENGRMDSVMVHLMFNATFTPGMCCTFTNNAHLGRGVRTEQAGSGREGLLLLLLFLVFTSA